MGFPNRNFTAGRLMKQTKSAALSVILVSYNSLAPLRSCIPSLLKAIPEKEKEVIVVDNNSEDGSREFIRRCHPGIKLIANSRNIGFGAANNQGAAEAHGEFLLFLNPDTVVYSDALVRLLTALKSDQKQGASGPALIQPKAKFQVSFGGRVHFFSEMIKKLGGNFLLSRWSKRRRTAKNVEWLSGACLMVRRDAWNQVSGFDENFFLYFEDIDLCCRLRDKGWKLRYIPSARVFHYGGVSAESAPMENRIHYRSSQLRFYRKHNRGFSRSCLKLYLLCEYYLHSLFRKWKGRESLRARYKKIIEEPE